MSRTIYNILTAMTALCIVTACTDNMEVTEEAVTGDTTAGYTFTIDGDAVTRLSHSGVTTTFESGEAVGCILCTMDTEGNYAYKANSKWTYSGGYLVPTTIYTTTSTTDDNSTTTSSTTSADVPTYSSASSSDLLAYNDNYVYVISSDRLYPFFYYPFIDNNTYSYVPSYSVNSTTENTGDTEVTDDTDDTEVTDDTDDTGDTEDTTEDETTETETTTYLLMGLAGESTDADYSDITTTVNGTETSTGYKTKTYAWTSYPVFINTDQSAESTTGDDGNTTTTTYKQDYSDFLWTSYPTGISSYSTGEINLEFEKKTATIEIDADEAISSVALYPTTSTESTGRIDVGNYINLQTGEYNTSSDNGLSYHRLTSSTDYITPLTVTSGTDYRFILPPQTSLTGNEVLQFTYDSDDDKTTRTIKLTDFASKLEAGKYYKVNVEKQKDTYYLYFTDPVATTVSSDTWYYTATLNSYPETGMFDAGYTGTPNQTVYYKQTSTDVGFTDKDGNSVSFDTQIRLRGGNNAYITISDIGRTSATVTLYAEYQSTDPVVKITDPSESTSTCTFSSVDSNAYMTTTFTTSSTTGTYTITRSSGNPNIFLVTVAVGQ